MNANDTVETSVGEIQGGTLDGTAGGPGAGSKACCVLEAIEGPAAGKRLEVVSKALVGRAPDCDLVINDQTVSRKHMRVLCKGKKASVLSLQDKNPVLVNGKAVKEADIADGDALTLGESVLRAHMAGASRKTAATKRSAGPNKVRIAIYVLLLVFSLGVIIAAIMPGGDDTPPEQTVLEQEKARQEEIQTANLKREIAVHLANGKQYFEAGNYTQAAGRFARVLELDPDNAQALDYSKRIEAILAERQEQELAAQKRAMELREKLSPLISKANVFIGTKNYEDAREVLLQAQELAPQHDEVLALLQQVETALDEQQKLEAQQEKLRERQLGKMERSYNKAVAYEQKGQHYRALKEYQYLLSLKPGGDMEAQAAAAAARLETELRELTAEDYQKGLKLLEKENTAEALKVWEGVLLVYPDHKDARAQIDRLLPAIADKGKQLYRDGLVLEDLGQMERALKKWQEAEELLTILGQDEYLEKSRKKIEQYRNLVGGDEDQEKAP